MRVAQSVLIGIVRHELHHGVQSRLVELVERVLGGIAHLVELGQRVWRIWVAAEGIWKHGMKFPKETDCGIPLQRPHVNLSVQSTSQLINATASAHSQWEE